ncbi:MAG TPA: helix-turn-helix domain-containing protein [Roseiflexaceae bacterium]|nr:helix-turn-helix domain-containing protein [Roseiflexaceae bacterium]
MITLDKEKIDATMLGNIDQKSLETRQMTDPILDVEDVAKRLKISVSTVRRLVREGELSAYRIGKQLRFSENQIQEYLKSQELNRKV